MDRVIVTVKKYNEARVRDLDLPAGLAATELADLVASALNWDEDSAGKAKRFAIQADPPGRLLGTDESLMEAGVVDGAWLTFILEGSKPVKAAVQQPPALTKATKDSQGPVKGWKSLEGIVPEIDSEPNNGDTDPDKKPPYVWKEVDI